MLLMDTTEIQTFHTDTDRINFELLVRVALDGNS